MATESVGFAKVCSLGKCKYQFSQTLSKVSNSQDQDLRKARLAQKKPILIYMSGERQKNGDITTQFSCSQWYLPAALRGFLRKSTMSENERSCAAQDLRVVRNFIGSSKDKPLNHPCVRCTLLLDVGSNISFSKSHFFSLIKWLFFFLVSLCF